MLFFFFTVCVPGCLVLTVITVCCSGPEWTLSPGTVCTLFSRDCRNRSAECMKRRGVEMACIYSCYCDEIVFFVLFFPLLCFSVHILTSRSGQEECNENGILYIAEKCSVCPKPGFNSFKLSRSGKLANQTHPEVIWNFSEEFLLFHSIQFKSWTEEIQHGKKNIVLI